MRYSTVYIDDKACTLSEDALETFGLKPKQRVSRDEFDDERLELLASFIEAEAKAMELIERSILSARRVSRN